MVSYVLVKIVLIALRVCFTHSFTILKPTHRHSIGTATTATSRTSLTNQLQFNHIRNKKYHSFPDLIHDEYNQPMKSMSKFPMIDKELLAIDYLEHELGLSTDVLKKIILKYPWILYLRVTTNIIPTIQVLDDNNFKQRDIVKIISQIPSILAINHKYTLPEKLLSLQKMFYLNKNNLVKLVTAQPYLLTSSIQRNLKTSEFFRNIVKLNENNMKLLLLKYPSLAMCSVDILKRCYNILITIYGIDRVEVNKIIVKYPMLLTKLLVHNIKERLIFFSTELDIPSFPNEYVRQVVVRFPPILYISTEIFLVPNIELLKLLINSGSSGSSSCSSRSSNRSDGTSCDIISSCSSSVNVSNCSNTTSIENITFSNSNRNTTITSGDSSSDTNADSNHKYLLGLIKTFPQLLGYNTNTLRKMILSALTLLTGRKHRFLHPMVNSEYKMNQFTFDNIINEDEDEGDTHDVAVSSGSGDEQVSGLLQLDLLSEAVEQYQLHSPDTTSNSSNSTNIDGVNVIVQHHQQAMERTAAIEYAQEEIHAIRQLSQPYLQHSTYEGSSVTYSDGLSLDYDTAVRVLRTAPWIIAYRPERSRTVLAALAVSLSLTSAELSKCVAMYPRLLSLSVDGKLTAVLQTIACAALTVQARRPHHTLNNIATVTGTAATTTAVATGNIPIKAANLSISSAGMAPTNATTSTTRIHSYSEWRRANPVRTMVREVILRYPHILGTRLELVSERFVAAAAAGVGWNAYLTVLRRNTVKHSQWLQKISANVSIASNNNSSSGRSSSSQAYPMLLSRSYVGNICSGDNNATLADTVLQVASSGRRRTVGKRNKRGAGSTQQRRSGREKAIQVTPSSGGDSSALSQQRQQRQGVTRSSKLSQVLAWRHRLAAGEVFPEYGPALLTPLPTVNTGIENHMDDTVQNNEEESIGECTSTASTSTHRGVAVMQIRSIFHNENRRVSASARHHLNALLPYKFLALD